MFLAGLRIGVTCCLAVGLLSPGSDSVDAAGPATLKESREVVNLEGFPLPAGVDTPKVQTAGQLDFSLKGTATSAYQALQKQLTGNGWKELPGSYLSEQVSTGNFLKQQFTLTVMVMPVGDTVNVSLVNRGNIDFKTLPVPKGTTTLHEGAGTLLLVTAVPVEKATSEIAEGLLKEGWIAYGEAGPQRFYKQNAVRLGVMVSAAPAQGGKTAITFSSELLSADLPAPPDAMGIHYVESNRTLRFTTTQPDRELQSFYRTELAKQGWEATTEQPIKVGFNFITIFRNPAKELLELETRGADPLQVGLKQLSAAQVEEQDRKGRAAAEKAKEKMNKPAATVTISLPDGADKGELSARQIKLNASTGNGQKVAAAIRKTLEADGWKTKVTIDQKETGAYDFEKEGQRVSLLFIDPGFIPAEVTLTGIGVDLKLGEKK